MKVVVFVEGVSDKLGLESLWQEWRTRLRGAGWGVAIIPLENKANFLKKFGPRAAQVLVGNADDIVVGLPDLHPTKPYVGTPFEHQDAASLKTLLAANVRKALEGIYGKSANQAESLLCRMCPSVLRHDFEMLLLAAVEALRIHLETAEKLRNWRIPVEDQNFDMPPKRIIEQIFLTKSRRRKAYRDTKDAPAVLKRVNDLRAILFTESGQCTCPEFVDVLRWLDTQTGVSPCRLP